MKEARGKDGLATRSCKEKPVTRRVGFQKGEGMRRRMRRSRSFVVARFALLTFPDVVSKHIQTIEPGRLTSAFAAIPSDCIAFFRHDCSPLSLCVSHAIQLK